MKNAYTNMVEIEMIMEKTEYERLVTERNDLSRLLKTNHNTPDRLKNMVEGRLKEIRTKLSNAHREQFKSTEG